ncbi:MAG: hypothetical protein RIR62_1711 [Pseudomonadota bacterium]
MDRLDCDRMFVAVIESGSFSAAARRIGTSSGQASKLVARLEQDLGVRLLNRTTRALGPTEAGRSYYQRIRNILDDLDTLDEELRARTTAPRGRLRLTAPLTFGTRQLVPALNAFVRAYPLIELDVSFTDRVVNLVDEGFDAAIRAGETGEANLTGRKLAEMTTCLVASDAYLAARAAPQAPADLAGHDCIIDTNFRDPLQWRFLCGVAEVVVPLTGRLRYSNAEACLRAAEMGLGIANVPDFVAARALAEGRVRALLPDCAPPPRGIWAMYPTGRHLAAKVRVLVDFLARRFHGQTDWVALEE